MNKLPFLNNGITQVALIVKNLDMSVENYWKTFRIGPWHFYTYAKPMVKHMTYYGKPADYEIRIGLSYFGPTRIELIEGIMGDSIYADFKKKGYGFHHFGMLVNDMEDALRLANNAGFKMIQEGSGFGLNGDGHYAYLDTYELFGVTLELIERPKRRVPPEKIYPSEEA